MACFSPMIERRPLLGVHRPVRLLVIVASLCAQLGSSQPNIDGGRGDLPGMKRDMFDQINKQKRGGQQQRMGKAPPDCPKSDKMTPFMTLAFAEGELFVRLEATEGPCHKLLSVGGANLTELKNASLTCGPAGEWKKRIAEEMSAVFFQGGWDWVKSDNDTIEVITEEGTFDVPVSEAKYAVMMECWTRSCGCEQASNPKMKIVLITLLVCALGGLSYDSVKLAWESFKGKKPPKHVVDPKGNRMVKVSSLKGSKSKDRSRMVCDLCRATNPEYTNDADDGTSYSYDLCTACYKKEREKVKEAWRKWCEKHPEDASTKKKKGGEGDEDEDADKTDDKAASGSEAGDKKDSKKDSEAESDDKKADSEAEKTGDEKDKDEAAGEAAAS